MKNDEVINAIQSVGMETFTKYYEAFIDDAKCSDDLHDALMKLEGFSDNSARTKVNSARRIIKNDMQLNALQIICDSQNKKITAWVSAKAKYLLESESNT